MTKRPKPETEYFGKIDIIKMRRIAESKKSEMEEEELERLKKLHWRHCAECGMEMESIPFKGVTVYKCFNCGSVFLPPGMLEKLCGEEFHLIDSLLELFRF